ncbi:MAG: segregation/condensation protein A [Labilithrix sp.]
MSEVDLNERPQAPGTPEGKGGFPVVLPTFEGPLDLLLHLCQKHELDILDIPIGFVTEKYLEYISVMQLLDLDVASEYLVMAATLAHIKSKMLLPAPPPGQEDDVNAEEEDPREALIKRLLEYQKYKAAAEDLQSRGVAGRDIFLRGSSIEEAVQTGLPPLAQVPLFSLVEAFQAVLEKSKVKLTHDIVHERITLADRINELVDLLRVKRRMTFEEFFDGATTRFDLVITFLALLEMTKLRMTRLFQADFNSQIYVEFCAQVTGDDETQETPPPSDEEAEAPAEHDSDKTIIDAAPPEIDDLLAPDEESARDLHANDAEEVSPHSSLTAEFVMPPGGLADLAPESEQITREMVAPAEAVAAAFPDDEAGTNKTATVAEAGSEADMLLASLGSDGVSPASQSDPPMTEDEPAPISQDVPPLDDEPGDGST